MLCRASREGTALHHALSGSLSPSHQTEDHHHWREREESHSTSFTPLSSSAIRASLRTRMLLHLLFSFSLSFHYSFPPFSLSPTASPLLPPFLFPTLASALSSLLSPTFLFPSSSSLPPPSSTVPPPPHYSLLTILSPTYKCTYRDLPSMGCLVRICTGPLARE